MGSAFEKEGDRGAAHAFEVLAGSGKWGLEPFTFVEATKSSEGDIAGHKAAGAAEDEIGPHGEQVTHGEDSSAGRGTGAKSDELIARSGKFPRSVDDPRVEGLDVGTCKGIMVAAQPFATDRGVVTEGDTSDAAMTEAGKVADDGESAMVVIGTDEISFEGGERGIHADEGDAGAAETEEDVVALMAVGDRKHDNAGDAVFAEEGDAASFFFLIVVGLAEEDLVARGVGGGFDATNDLGVIGIGEVRDENADDARAVAFECAGGVVGVVVKFLCDAEDASTGFGVVAGVFTGKDVGDRTDGESGGGSDIAKGDGHKWPIRIVTKSIARCYTQVKRGGRGLVTKTHFANGRIAEEETRACEGTAEGVTDGRETLDERSVECCIVWLRIRRRMRSSV